MNLISKRFRFEQMWEVVVIDGEMYFLVRDILKHFGFSQKSQNTVKKYLEPSQHRVVTGEPIRPLKHISAVASMVTLEGLKQFITGRYVGEERERGDDLLEFIELQVTDEMNELWRKYCKANKIKPKVEKVERVENEYTLFDAQKDVEIEELTKQVDKLARRVKRIEDIIDRNEQTTVEVNGERMVPLSTLKRLFEDSDPLGHVRGEG